MYWSEFLKKQLSLTHREWDKKQKIKNSNEKKIKYKQTHSYQNHFAHKENQQNKKKQKICVYKKTTTIFVYVKLFSRKKWIHFNTNLFNFISSKHWIFCPWNCCCLFLVVWMADDDGDSVDKSSMTVVLTSLKSF